jgi:hypothetical protein
MGDTHVAVEYPVQRICSAKRTYEVQLLNLPPILGWLQQTSKLLLIKVKKIHPVK